MYRRGFFAVCLAYCAIILDGSVLNVAIPATRDHLGSSMAAAQWVLDGYTLPLAALLLTAGALGDRLGLRRMLLAGLALFTAASAACAAAPDATWLIASRAVQGVGAAALLPATLALIPHLFTRQADRERATIAWVAAGSVAVAAGLILGERPGGTRPSPWARWRAGSPPGWPSGGPSTAARTPCCRRRSWPAACAPWPWPARDSWASCFTGRCS
jgi:DHA2 family methylenomycin A resistance protein-like MFS transporter